jgi:PAS domain S-box-containing protein
MSSSYNTQLVILSVLIACVASYAALFLAAHVANTTRGRMAWLIAGATAMGTGIWSMHFIAMLAYQLPVSIGYDVPLLALSLAIAIAASSVGLRIAGRAYAKRRQLLVAGLMMGLAIAGMHYVGMAGMRLPATQHYDARLVAASVAIAVAASYAAIALFLRFRTCKSRTALWLKIGSAVVMGHAVAGMHYTGMAAVHFEHATMRSSGLVLPPAQLAVAIAVASTMILALIVAGGMLDRWAQTMRSVRESEERFRIMVDAVEDYAIIMLDADGLVGSWNRGAERLLGYGASDVLGQPLRRLYPVTDASAADTELRVATETGRYEGEGIRVVGNDHERFVNITTAAMRGENNELVGFVRILRDVTEKRRAEDELRHREKQLRQSQKMEAVGQLAGGVAHDFNNMLTAIRGYTELLLHDDDTNGTTGEALAEIRKATDRAASLTRQLLAFSRKQMLQPRAVNPNAIVRDMESMLRRLLVGDLELATSLDEYVGQITVDPAQLEQVLLNLVVNARDAMPEGGRILIRTANVDLDDTFCSLHEGAKPGPHVVLSVSDTGVGMTDEIKRHIFEPFFTTKERGAGTGLGLSTVYGIVKQSGGYIDLESEFGRGSTFHIYFPRTHEAVLSPVSTRNGTTPENRRGTILLVDDEESVRRMLTSLLERLGYSVMSASDGVEALELSSAHAGPIELLITDMMMPRMHGKELSERLTVLRPTIRVLFTSGYADDDVIERGLLDSRMAFIQKPFSMGELASKITETLPEQAHR